MACVWGRTAAAHLCPGEETCFWLDTHAACVLCMYPWCAHVSLCARGDLSFAPQSYFHTAVGAGGWCLELPKEEEDVCASEKVPGPHRPWRIWG